MRFASYGGFNRKRSSLVDLLATDGIIKKVKPECISKRQIEEFFSLHILGKIIRII